jgi:hypothetical protein
MFFAYEGRSALAARAIRYGTGHWKHRCLAFQYFAVPILRPRTIGPAGIPDGCISEDVRAVKVAGAVFPIQGKRYGTIHLQDSQSGRRGHYQETSCNQREDATFAFCRGFLGEAMVVLAKTSRNCRGRSIRDTRAITRFRPGIIRRSHLGIEPASSDFICFVSRGGATPAARRRHVSQIKLRQRGQAKLLQESIVLGSCPLN